MAWLSWNDQLNWINVFKDSDDGDVLIKCNQLDVRPGERYITVLVIRMLKVCRYCCLIIHKLEAVGPLDRSGTNFFAHVDRTTYAEAP